jgi:hypothetical protein
MAGPTTRARASWVADRVTALPEVWALVALHLGLVICGGGITSGVYCGGLTWRRWGGKPCPRLWTHGGTTRAVL